MQIIFRNLLVTLMIIIGIAAALLIGYLIWILLRHHLVAFLLCVHLALGVIASVFSMLFMRMTKAKGGVDAFVVKVSEVRAAADSHIARRLLIRSLDLLSGVLNGLAWIGILVPSILLGIRNARRGNKFNYLKGNAEASAAGVFQAFPYGMAVLVILLYGLAWLRPEEIAWSRVFAAVLLAATVTRLLQNAVSPTSLAEQVRSLPGVPWLRFTGMAALDAISIVLSFNAVANWASGVVFAPDSLQAIAGNVFVFGSVLDLAKMFAHGQSLPLITIAQTLIGAIYGIVILDSLKDFKQFSRTDLDRMSIARLYTAMGRYNESFAQLRGVKLHDIGYHVLNAANCLGVMQPDRAWEATVHYLIIMTETSSYTPSAARVLAELVSLCLVFDLPKDARRQLIRTALARQVADLYSANAMFNLFMSLAPLEKSDALTSGVDEVRQPLTHAQALILTQALSAAQAALSNLVPSTLGEMAMYRRMDVLAVLLSPDTSPEEDRNNFVQWNSEAFPWFSELKVEDVSDDDLPLVFGTLEAAVQWTKRLHPSAEQSWQFLLDRFKQHKVLLGNAVLAQVLA